MSHPRPPPGTKSLQAHPDPTPHSPPYLPSPYLPRQHQREAHRPRVVQLRAQLTRRAGGTHDPPRTSSSRIRGRIWLCRVFCLLDLNPHIVLRAVLANVRLGSGINTTLQSQATFQAPRTRPTLDVGRYQGLRGSEVSFSCRALVLYGFWYAGSAKSRFSSHAAPGTGWRHVSGTVRLHSRLRVLRK